MIRSRRLCNSQVSARSSVCPIDRQQQRRAAGLLQAGRRRQISVDIYCAAAGGQRHVVIRGTMVDADLFDLYV